MPFFVPVLRVYLIFSLPKLDKNPFLGCSIAAGSCLEFDKRNNTCNDAGMQHICNNPPVNEVGLYYKVFLLPITVGNLCFLGDGVTILRILIDKMEKYLTKFVVKSWLEPMFTL